jgi:hypothetical protein
MIPARAPGLNVACVAVLVGEVPFVVVSMPVRLSVGKLVERVEVVVKLVEVEVTVVVDEEEEEEVPLDVAVVVAVTV